MEIESIKRPSITLYDKNVPGTEERKYSPLIMQSSKQAGKGILHIEHDVLLIVLEGKITLNFSNKTEIISQNQMIVLHQGEKPTFLRQASSSGKPFEALFLFICNDLIKAYQIHYPNRSTRSKNMKEQKIYALTPQLIYLNKLINSYLNDADFSCEHIEHHVVEILSLIQLDLYPLYDECKIIALQHALHIKAIRDLSQGKTVLEIASHYNTSTATYYRIYKRQYGTPPGKDLQIVRINTAKILLAQKNLSIGDIAKALGYKGSCNFSTAYKHYTGLTPTEEKQKLEQLELSKQQNLFSSIDIEDSQNATDEKPDDRQS